MIVFTIEKLAGKLLALWCREASRWVEVQSYKFLHMRQISSLTHTHVTKNMLEVNSWYSFQVSKSPRPVYRLLMGSSLINNHLCDRNKIWKQNVNSYLNSKMKNSPKNYKRNIENLELFDIMIHDVSQEILGALS